MGIGQLGIGGILLISVVVLVLFGRGKVSSLMGEVGKGITAFKKGVNDSETEAKEAASEIEQARDVTPAEETTGDKTTSS